MRAYALIPILLVASCGATPVFAADPSSALSFTLQSLFDYVAAGFATFVVAVVAGAARKLFGLELDRRHRETLHSALRTAAGLVIALVADLVAKGMSPAEARSAALEQGVTYVKGAAADAVKRFGLQDSDGQILDMLTSTATQLHAARG